MLTFVGENNRLLTGGQGVRPLAEVLRSEFLPNLFSLVYHQSYIHQLASLGEDWIFWKIRKIRRISKFVWIDWAGERRKINLKSEKLCAVRFWENLVLYSTIKTSSPKIIWSLLEFCLQRRCLSAQIDLNNQSQALMIYNFLQTCLSFALSFGRDVE